MNTRPVTAPVISFSTNSNPLINTRTYTLNLAAAVDSRAKLVSLTCQLDQQNPQDCSSLSITFTDLTDGSHAVKIDGIDSLGQKAQEVVALFQVDATPPTVMISQQPVALTSGTTGTFIFTASDPNGGSGIFQTQCSLDGSSYSPCMSPFSASALAAGNHSIKIRAVDVASNFSTEFTYAWVIDVTAPLLSFSLAPTPFTRSSSQEIHFGSNKIGSTFACKLDNGAFAPCTTADTQLLSGLSEGSHTFQVQATDVAGNVSAPLPVAWIVDLTPPTLPSLSSNIVGTSVNSMLYSNMTTANFVFTSTDALSGFDKFQCALDLDDYADCMSPKALAGLSSGPHSFKVVALDKAGNVSAVKSMNWIVDILAPTISLTQVPAATSVESSAMFGFTVTDALSGVLKTECMLDNGNFTPCSSPSTFTGLANGNHNFTIKATDNAGNATATLYSWAIVASPIYVKVQDASVLQGGSLSIVASLSYAQTQQVTVNLTTRAGTALPGVDYTEKTAAVVIPAGQLNSNALIVPTLLNNINYADKTFYVDIASVPGGAILNKTATIKLASLYLSLNSADVQQVAMGGSFGAVLYKTGAVKIWGTMTNLNDDMGVPTLQTVAGMTTGVAKIALGDQHLCALMQDKTVRCYGANSSGQLGIGTLTVPAIPSQDVGINNAIEIAAGGNSSCAIIQGGTVKCWGNLALSVASGSNFQAPTDIPGFSGVVQVAVKGNVCAVIAGGQVACQGANGLGQLGNATRTDSFATPVLASGVVGAVQVVMVTGTACAVFAQGNVKCWGASLDINLPFTPTPVDLGLSGIVQMSAGNAFMCALSSAGTIKCFGQSVFGDLGNGTDTGSGTRPLTDVINVAGATQITSGYDSTCATTNLGYKCWGGNVRRETVGQDLSITKKVPLPLPGGLSLSSIVSSTSASCGITATGGVKCWGANTQGQLGDNSTISPTFVQVTNTPTDVVGLTNVIGLAGGAGLINVSTDDGFHFCALTAGGAVYCWGTNVYGQLGNNSTFSSSVPVVVSGLTSGVQQVVTGGNYSCALTVGGTVKCWGSNSSGQLGINAAIDQSPHPLPADIVGLTGVKKLEASSYHICALLNTGAVKCWGSNGFGELGNNTKVTSAIPVDVQGLTGVQQLALSAVDSCALTAGGTVKCWGGKQTTRNGNINSNSLVPTDIVTNPTTNIPLSNVVQISSGLLHNCALLNDGSVKCWNLNIEGSFGNGTRYTGYYPTTAGMAMPAITKVMASNYQTCFWSNDLVRCTGAVVTPTTYDAPTPVPLSFLSSVLSGG